MGKVIDLTAKDTPIWWSIRAGCPFDDGERIQCDYVGDDKDFRGAQWAIVVRASSIDRVQELVEAAKLLLARSMAANVKHGECAFPKVGRKAAERQRGGRKEVQQCKNGS